MEEETYEKAQEEEKKDETEIQVDGWLWWGGCGEWTFEWREMSSFIKTVKHFDFSLGLHFHRVSTCSAKSRPLAKSVYGRSHVTLTQLTRGLFPLPPPLRSWTPLRQGVAALLCLMAMLC